MLYIYNDTFILRSATSVSSTISHYTLFAPHVLPKLKIKITCKKKEGSVAKITSLNYIIGKINQEPITIRAEQFINLHTVPHYSHTQTNSHASHVGILHCVPCCSSNYTHKHYLHSHHHAHGLIGKRLYC